MPSFDTALSSVVPSNSEAPAEKQTAIHHMI